MVRKSFLHTYQIFKFKKELHAKEDMFEKFRTRSNEAEMNKARNKLHYAEG
jgi:hypothetical protein